MWKKEYEDEIQQMLLQINPDYRGKIKRGFFFGQMPSKPSRFYMRDALAWLQVNVGEHRRLLDYGCGVGTFMAYLWMHGFKNLTGADITESDLDTAALILKHFKVLPNHLMHVQPEQIYELPQHYDCIFMFDYLYGRAFNLDHIIHSAFAALAPGGVLMFDLFDYEETPNPGRQYFDVSEVAAKVKDMFNVVQTTTHRRGNSKTMYILRRVPQ